MAEKTGIPIATIFASVKFSHPTRHKPVTSIEEAKRRYRSLPHGSPQECELILEWIKLCTTPQEVRVLVLRYAPNKSFVQAYAMHRWRMLSSDEIRRATSREQAMEAHANTPHNSPERSRAMRKWIHFCDRLDHLLEARKATIRGSKEELMAVKKIVAFYEHA